MTEPRSPADQALDLLVYAPLGLALAIRSELPKLIERGRSQTDPQVALARMLGQMAVGKGQQEARRVLNELWARVGGNGEGVKPPPPATAVAPEHRSSPPPATVAKSAPAPPAEGLAIPGYASLSAPQVVQRLNGLSPEELDAVHVYETATRRRQTILGRIAQLRSPGS